MRRVVIVGGGAAGFFAAINCAELAPNSEVVILEKTAHLLSKVRISGGGRCNVTHSCFEPRTLTGRYPRGERALTGPFSKFQPRDTIEWFEARGVRLKTESDGRMFPTSNSSQTIIDCLVDAAKRAGVRIVTGCGVDSAKIREDGCFDLALSNGEQMTADRLLLATGGCRAPAAGRLAESLGHSIVAPVPSLFTFHIEKPWLHELAGVSVENAEVSAPGTKLRERGPMLITHWGLSGPAVLRLSAWGARILHEQEYRFPLVVNWLPSKSADELRAELASFRESQPAKLVANTALLSSRLWEALVAAAGIPRETRWANLTRPALQTLVAQLNRSEFAVSGKSLNKDEFVTCGGVPLTEVDLRTMESRITPRLHFAGELLDIDGITGGFNFQAAWTTGWLAARALSGT
jgi:predicted Rossmann fold flavoprotein